MNDFKSLAVTCQGLPARNHFTAGENAVAEVITHLGYLQIDTISVVARAHHHTLWNRVHDYQTCMLDSAINDRSVFEYWAHAAAYLPMSDYRFAQIRMREMREGKSRWVRSTDTRLMRKVLKRIEAEGPLRSRDFESTSKATNGWWDWKPTKHALEQLFMQGDLMVTGRQGFQKRYDLRDRVLPDHIDTRFPSQIEYANYLVDTQLRSWGASPEPSFTYLLRGRELRTAVAEVLAERLHEELLELHEVDGQRWYLNTTQQAATPERTPTTDPTRACLLSPFDNLVIQRERLKAVFGFDYVLECYVPEAKRKYGYFTLPVLLDNQFIGRMDCKVHRKTGIFEVKRLFWENGVDTVSAMPLIAQEMVEFARFNGAGKVKLAAQNQRGPQGSLNKALKNSLAAAMRSNYVTPGTKSYF